MPNNTEHSVRIKGDNKDLKKVINETERIFKKSAATTKSYASVLKQSFANVKKEIEGVNDSLKDMMKNLTSGPGGGAMKMLGRIGMIGGGMLAGGAMAAVYQRIQTADQGLQLNAFGAGNKFRNNTAMGYSAQETLQQRIALTQGMGGTGGGLSQIQALSRATGLDASSIIGSASVRREIGGGKNISAVRRTMSILSETLGETFDKGRLGSFMSSIDQTLSSIGSGVNIDEKSFVNAFSNLIKDPTMKAAPGRASQALGAIDNTFRNASGNSFGLIMQLMSDAMPNGTPLERMFEARRGVFAKGQLGGEDRQKRIFGSMQGMFQDMEIGGSNKRDEILRSMFLQNNFGVQGADVAKSLGNAINEGDINRAVKEAKGLDNPKSLQKTANEIMSSTDGEIKSINALMKNLLDDVGNKIVPAVIGMAKKVGVDVDKYTLRNERIIKRETNPWREDDRKRTKKFLRNMSSNRNFYAGNNEEMGSLYRSMDNMSDWEQGAAKSVLEKEIAAGKNKLANITDPEKRENISKLIDRMEQFVERLERLENKGTNVTVKNSRNRVQDITSKSFGQMK